MIQAFMGAATLIETLRWPGWRNDLNTTKEKFRPACAK